MAPESLMKLITAIAVTLIGLGPFNCLAQETPGVNPFKATLSAVPSAELPAKAAELVKSAKSREREATTINVVKAAVTLNPGAAAPTVGAIARAVPEMAALAAATAAAGQPRQAGAIARAAAASAPSKVAKIVAAVCQAVPNDYRSVATSVAQVSPTSAREILKSVETAVPELKPYIDRELAGYGLTVPPVAETLDQAQTALTRVNQAMAAQGSPAGVAAGPTAAPSTAPVMRGASGGPPYIPPADVGSRSPPPAGGDTTSGGRNYSRP